MPTGYTFDAQTVRRIYQTVRDSEQRFRVNTSRKKRDRPVQDGWRSFRNDAGEPIPPFAVMAVTGTVGGDIQDEGVLKCEKPSATFRRVYAVNGPEEIEDGEYGLCRLPPFDNVEVLYDTTSGTPAIGEGWGPKPDSFKLFKNYPCTAIAVAVLSDLSGSETMLAHWGPIVSGIGKANGTISNRASGAISIWQGTLGSESEISSMDPTAFNLGPDLASGDWVYYDHINGQLVCVKLCD